MNPDETTLGFAQTTVGAETPAIRLTTHAFDLPEAPLGDSPPIDLDGPPGFRFGGIKFEPIDRSAGRWRALVWWVR